MRPVKFPVQVRSHIPYSVCYIIYVTCSRDALYQCLLAIKYVFLQWMTLTIDIRLYINHGLQITSPSTCTASQPKHRHMLSFYFILSSSWERSNVQQSLISILERNSTIFQIFGYWYRLVNNYEVQTKRYTSRKNRNKITFMKYIILGAAIAWAMYMADKYLFF